MPSETREQEQLNPYASPQEVNELRPLWTRLRTGWRCAVAAYFEDLYLQGVSRSDQIRAWGATTILGFGLLLVFAVTSPLITSWLGVWMRGW